MHGGRAVDRAGSERNTATRCGSVGGWALLGGCSLAMGGCTIDLSHEYSVPWEKVVVSYIHKMENDADGEVERRDVKLERKEAVEPPPISSSSSDPGDSPSSCDDEADETQKQLGTDRLSAVEPSAAKAIEVGDRVRLTDDGESLYPDGCLALGDIGEVLAQGQFAVHHRTWDKTVTKMRVRALGGVQRVYWYPCSALELERWLPPRPSWDADAHLPTNVPAPDVPIPTVREAPAVSMATWAYAIVFSMPWIFRKVFKMDTVQLATTERLDMQDRVLENTMVNVSQVMGVQINEWTKVAPNPETGGCTWTRRLTVEYPDWLPGWAVTKIKKAYTEASVGAREKDEQLCNHADCEQRVLSCTESADFYRELGLANDSGLVYTPCGH